MKVAIIGAGFAGLATAYYLSKEGVDVTVYEAEEKPGGLAIGFKESNWDWTLEKHYHHWFTNDDSILDLAKEIGHGVMTVRPKTSLYYGDGIYQLDSPLSLLKFPHLPIINRIRAGFTLFLLKYVLPWKPLERITSDKFLKVTMGIKSWEVLWEPLFSGKFHKYKGRIPASWFWARIKKRTQSLAYPEGGYQFFADQLEKITKEKSCKFVYGVQVNKIEKVGSKFLVELDGGKKEYDKVICTLPSVLFAKVVKGLPKDYVKNITKLDSIHALNVVLRLKKDFFADGSYWLSVNDRKMPFIAVVEHTHFMDKSHYGNESLIYIGNYLPLGHEYFDLSVNDLLNLFIPHLKKINKSFNEKDIIKAYKFPGYFAQPIIPLNYSKDLPEFVTPIDGLYLNNMQQVYPWDRGTNYAVQNSKKVVELIMQDTHK